MENVENLILEHLRAIRSDVNGIRDDVREVKNRLANVEATQGTMMQGIGHLASVDAQQHVNYDRLLERIERLERRMELTN